MVKGPVSYIELNKELKSLSFITGWPLFLGQSYKVLLLNSSLINMINGIYAFNMC